MIVGRVNCTGGIKPGQWLVDQMKRSAPLINENSLIQLPIHLKKLIPSLQKIGFNIDTIQQMGAPKDCLQRLIKNKKTITEFESCSLSLSNATKKDLKAVKLIEGKEFKRNP